MKKKDFHDDFYFFLNKVKNNKPFSLSRWGDGELLIIENKFIDLRNVKNGEFRYDPNISEYSEVRNKLMKSYVAKDDDYYIGVACPYCVGQKRYEYMKTRSEQDEEHLTWANIFVNSNYKLFMSEFVEEMKSKDVIMVVNNKANVDRLQFDVEKTYLVGTDAWYSDYGIIEDIKKDYKDKSNKIFLFAAGPFANILTYELWFGMSKNNIYVDIGSTLDTQMGMKATRGYHSGAPTLKKKCIW